MTKNEWRLQGACSNASYGRRSKKWSSVPCTFALGQSSRRSPEAVRELQLSVRSQRDWERLPCHLLALLKNMSMKTGTWGSLAGDKPTCSSNWRSEANAGSFVRLRLECSGDRQRHDVKIVTTFNAQAYTHLRLLRDGALKGPGQFLRYLENGDNRMLAECSSFFVA